MGIHSRARPTIASLPVSYGNGYENFERIGEEMFAFCVHKVTLDFRLLFRVSNHFLFSSIIINVVVSTCDIV